MEEDNTGMNLENVLNNSIIQNNEFDNQSFDAPTELFTNNSETIDNSLLTAQPDDVEAQPMATLDDLNAPVGEEGMTLESPLVENNVSESKAHVNDSDFADGLGFKEDYSFKFGNPDAREEENVETPVEGVAEQTIEEPAEEVVGETIEEPVEEVVEQTIEEPAEEVVGETIEEPVEEEIIEVPVEEELLSEPVEEDDEISKSIKDLKGLFDAYANILEDIKVKEEKLAVLKEKVKVQEKELNETRRQKNELAKQLDTGYDVVKKL